MGYHPHARKKAEKYPDRESLGYCINCSRKNATKVNDSRQVKRDSNPKAKIKENGKIYLIGAGDGNPIKIGYTVGSVEKRLQALRMSYWGDMNIVFQSEKINQVLRFEISLHKIYKHKHVRGEWFNLTPDDVKDIQKLCTEKFENSLEGS